MITAAVIMEQELSIPNHAVIAYQLYMNINNQPNS
jgi:hypothetical protein